MTPADSTARKSGDPEPAGSPFPAGPAKLKAVPAVPGLVPTDGADGWAEVFRLGIEQGPR